MKVKLGLIICALFISTSNVFAQSPEELGQPVAGVQNDPDVDWKWGEVESINPQTQTLNLKYLDYEADQEKDLVIGVDSSTTYENVASFQEIKPNDNLSVDYILAADGKAIAKNISLEKSESTPAIAPLVKDAAIESNVQTPPASEEVSNQSAQQ